MINNPNIKYHLNKDILQQGMQINEKVYSPEICMWTSAYNNATQSKIDNKYKCKNKYYDIQTTKW